MILTEVRTKQDEKDFLELPSRIYRNIAGWVRPLDKDITAVFDAARNPYFEHGEAIRWILKDKKGDVIGRVAAFVNFNNAYTFEQPTGGMGFFECINDRDAAFKLFDACSEWLSARGMEAMDGPINFGEKDRYWGLLTEGFTEPVYLGIFNPPYYKDLFEAYGFQLYYGQYYYQLVIGSGIPERYHAIYQRIKRNSEFHCEHIRKGQEKKYAKDFCNIYNRAWVTHNNFKPITEEKAVALMKTIEPVMDEDVFWFAYHNDDPAGMFLMLPDINQLLKYSNNGKLGLLEKLQFAYHRWRGKCRKIYGFVFGVAPEYQGKGVESLLILESWNHVAPLNRYDVLELAWIGDFNPKMVKLVEGLGTQKIKTAVTYRKLFDETRPFKRSPIITADSLARAV